MKNSKNKIIAATVSGIIIGSIGTSFLGNFQVAQENNIASSNTFENKSDANNKEENNQTENKETPSSLIPEGMSEEEFEAMLKNGEGKNGKRPGHHHEGQGSLETEESVNISGQYSDGTYEGQASAYGPNLKVQVVISSSKISDIKIVSHNETPGFYEKAFEEVPSQIIKKQSTDVDTVSGATYSSVGIINAVNNALKGADSSQESTKDVNSNLETNVQ